MKLEAVRRVTVSEAVTERIAALIAQGKLKQGDRLPPETELMRQLNVGRSSIREAIRGLAMLGVVSARPRRGTIVTSPQGNRLVEQLDRSIAYWGLKDLYEVRAVLEGHSAAEAARLRTAEQLAEINRVAVAMERKIAKGANYFKENQAFHMAVARASQNSVLFFCLKTIIGGLRDLREKLEQIYPAFPERDIAEHRRIVDAITARDPALARRLMDGHMRFHVKQIERMKLGSRKGNSGGATARARRRRS